jgi:uncharacterized protein HemX
MARNRKYQTAAMRFGPALKASVLCLLIGGAGVGYVWQKNQIYQLGQQKKQRETRLKQLAEHNKKLEKQLQSMWTPAFLEQRIKDLKLGLAAPPTSQVWRLPEPARDSPRGTIAAQDKRETATQ